MYEYEFRDILDSNERIIWSDKPNLMVHLASGIPLLILGIIWGIMDSFFFRAFMTASGGMFGFLSIFMLLHMMPLWLGIGNIIRLILVYRNTYFCYTDKRVIIKTGFMGVDYKIRDFYNIADVEVNINPLENMLGVGTIKIDEAYEHRQNNSRKIVGNRLYGIKNPYDVFKVLKQTIMDIKSDINYPNDYRPETNRGYNTKYTK